MPQAGGLDLLKALRGGWPEVPVLIITGFASIPSAVEATRLGATGYLPKPFTPEELEKAVEDVAARGPWKAQAADQIDVDIPFSAKEVEEATSSEYVEHLTRSDMTVAQAAPQVAACNLAGLLDAWPDIIVKAPVHSLVEALFPSKPSHLYATYASFRPGLMMIASVGSSWKDTDQNLEIIRVNKTPR